MTKKGALGMLAAGICAAGAFAMSAAPAMANTSAAGLGMNGWYLFWGTPASSWNTQVATMAADGVKVVRADAFWNIVQPTSASSYSWAATDAIVDVLAAHGITWEPIIDYSTPWAESSAGDVDSAPISDSAYATYAAAVVARYGPTGTFWAANPSLTKEPVTAVEIWNGENENVAAAMPAAQYAGMYFAARTAVHSVNSSVEVIVGALGNPSASYIASVEQTLGTISDIDAVALQAYGTTPNAVGQSVSSARTALDKLGGANVPLDVSEFGWPTEGSGSATGDESDSNRASYMTTTINALANSDCGVERIQPYAWETSQASSSVANDWFGVTNLGAPTATSAAITAQYKSIASKAEGASATVALCGRPLTLKLATVSSTSKSDNFCVQATALTWNSSGMANVGVSGATVTFSAPSAQTVTTGSTGTATACWEVSSPSSTTATGVVSDPQYYSPQSSETAST